MTKEKALEISLILKAYSEGKTIQRMTMTTWVDVPILTSDNLKQATMPIMEEYQEYRIKPEKKLVPFTFEDNILFRDKWVKGINSTRISLSKIVRFSKESISIASQLDINSYSYKEFLAHFTFEDGSPCGKYVEE